MNDVDLKEYLGMPIWHSNDIEDMSTFTGFNKIYFKTMMQRQNKVEFSGIQESLMWAEKNPEHDFASMNPYKARHNNKDIYKYLYLFNKEMSNMEYDESLYTEDYWDKDPDEQEEWDDYVRATIEKREKEKG